METQPVANIELRKRTRKQSPKMEAMGKVFSAYWKAKGIPDGAIGNSEYGRNGKAAKAILELANGNAETATAAVNEIGGWLARLEADGKIGFWSLEAVVNNYERWVAERFKSGKGIPGQTSNDSNSSRERPAPGDADEDSGGLVL